MKGTLMTDKLFPGKFLFVGGPADGKFNGCPWLRSSR
jgi:hypothetical protein